MIGWITHTFNPLQPNISIHILHTVLCTLTMVLTKRISLTIKSFFSWGSFPLFSWYWCMIQWWYCKENFKLPFVCSLVTGTSDLVRILVIHCAMPRVPRFVFRFHVAMHPFSNRSRVTSKCSLSSTTRAYPPFWFVVGIFRDLEVC